MKPFKQTCLFIFLAATFFFGSGDTRYILSENQTTWEEANRTCVLATPNIHYSFEYSNTVDLGPDWNVSGYYWVGYTTHNSIFQYIDPDHSTSVEVDWSGAPLLTIDKVGNSIWCSLESDVTGLSNRNFSLPSDPGLCYSACGSDIFGMKNRECYCFETRPEVDATQETCVTPCTIGGIKCGGPSDVISLFSVANINLNNVSGNPSVYDYCIAFHPQNSSFIWKECTSHLKTRCQSKGGAHFVSGEDSLAWDKSANDCFSMDAYPLSSKLEQLGSDSRESLWTGFFRSDNVVRNFEGPGEPLLYGRVYASSGDERAKLRFEGQSNYHAICVDDTTTTTVKAEETTTIPPAGANESTTWANNTTALKRSDDDSSKDDNLFLIIGIPLVIIVCVAVIVIGVICYKRRRSKAAPSTQARCIVEQYSQVKDPYDEGQNVYNEPYDKFKGTSNKTSKNVDEKQNRPDDDDEYDVTGAAEANRTERTFGENIYNKLQLVDDDTYDHTDGAKDTRSTRGNASVNKIAYETDDDNYNISGQDGAKKAGGDLLVVADNMYDHVNREEGSYSQINMGKGKKDITDNVYN